MLHLAQTDEDADDDDGDEDEVEFVCALNTLVEPLSFDSCFKLGKRVTEPRVPSGAAMAEREDCAKRHKRTMAYNGDMLCVDSSIGNRGEKIDVMTGIQFRKRGHSLVYLYQTGHWFISRAYCYASVTVQDLGYSSHKQFGSP